MKIVVQNLILFTLILTWCSCSFTERIENGETAFERKQYAVAVNMLAEEYEEVNNKRVKARAAYLCALSYDILGKYKESLDWFEKSDRNGYGPEASMGLALAYKKMKSYPEAILVLEKLQNETPGDRNVQRELFIVKEAQRWDRENTEAYSLEIMRQNSDNSDYAPQIFEDNFLVFTSDREGATGGDDYKWTGKKFSDIYVMLKDGSEVRKFDAIINSKHNEGAACFSADNKEMYFTRCYATNATSDEFCKLMYSDRYEGIWSEPVPLSFVGNGLNYGQPTLIENDSVLVFSCKAEDGRGGHDLYYSVRSENGIWSEPDLMPESINTAGNEMFPTSDGDTLYFSSDFLPGLGGLDVFKTHLRSDGRWSPPQNMKQPINSSFDDFGLVLDRSTRLRGNIVEKGYLSSNRSGLGSDDLYAYSRKKIVAPPTDTTVVVDVPEKSLKIFLAGRVVEPTFEIDGNPNSRIRGKIPVPNALITLTVNESQDNFQTDESGRFIKEISLDQLYTIKAGKRDYFNDVKQADSGALDIKEGERDYTINVELTLNRIYKNTEINLKNIYYDTDKWFIRKDAEPTLNELADLLKNNLQIKSVQLSSHTDCRATDEYNIELSQKRAQSAVDYLISVGVAPSRLVAQGYGETQPAVNCECNDCSDDELQANRRTTFKIIE